MARVIVGVRMAELSLQKGLLFNTSEALNLGLVDKVAAENDLLTSAHNEMNQWLIVPGS